MTQARETIPHHYGDIMNGAPLTYADVLAMQQTGASEFPGLVNTLRKEITDGPDDEVLTVGIMATARVLADHELAISDKTDKAQVLLDSTIYESLVGLGTSYDTEGTLSYGPAHYAEYEDGRHVHASPEGVEGYASLVQQAAKKYDITLRHPADARLFGYTQMAGHEAGHALLGGISVAIREKNGEPFSRGVAVRHYLGAHPDQGFTGNWDVDVAIFGERFAESYGNLAARGMMAAAGYSPFDSEMLMKAFDRSPDISGEPGNNQIDHLSLSNHLMGPHDRVTDKKSVHALNLGRFGYELPLFRRQMVAVLTELHDAAFSVEDTSAHDPWPAGWEHDVLVFQHPDIKAHIKQIKKSRHDALQAMQEQRNTIATQKAAEEAALRADARWEKIDRALNIVFLGTVAVASTVLLGGSEHINY
jgi:hypothetical protein